MSLKESALGGAIQGLFIVIGIILGLFIAFVSVKYWISTIDLKDLFLDAILK